MLSALHGMFEQYDFEFGFGFTLGMAILLCSSSIHGVEIDYVPPSLACQSEVEIE